MSLPAGFSLYDPIDLIKTEEEQKAYLKVAFESNNPRLIELAQQDIARAQERERLKVPQ